MPIDGLMMNRPLMAISLMEYAATYHGDCSIITRSIEGPVHRTNYANTYSRIQKLAHALVASGVKPGDRIATLAWNTWRHLELYYAIAGIGAVCHTVNPRLSPDQMAYVINHAEDRFIFLDSTFVGFVPGLRKVARNVEKFIILTDAANMPPSASDKDFLFY